MGEETKGSIQKNIKRVLMFKAIDKIHRIIDDEKKQKKSDKMHVTIIIGAIALSLALTFIVSYLFEL